MAVFQQLINDAMGQVILPTGHVLEFNFYETVYLKTDPDQHPRLVTEIHLYPGKQATYTLSMGTTNSTHYSGEITRERDVVKATS